MTKYHTPGPFLALLHLYNATTSIANYSAQGIILRLGLPAVDPALRPWIWRYGLRVVPGYINGIVVINKKCIASKEHC